MATPCRPGGAQASGRNDKERAEFATATNRVAGCYGEGMVRTIGLLVLDGVTDSGVSVALDVLRAANALRRREGRRDAFDVKVLSKGGRAVTTAAGLRLGVHGAWTRARRCDVLLVPGCWVETPGEVAALLARKDVEACTALLQAGAKRGAVVGASCTGAFVLAAAGLLDGRRATTTWWLGSELRKRFPRVEVDDAQSLVSEGQVLSAGTVFAMADLALALVARWAGPTIARRVTKVLLLDTHTSQGPYMVLTQVANDEPAVRAAEAWVRRNLSRPGSVGQLARAVGLSPRTLARRLDASLGLSPIGFIRRIRLETAAQLFETSRLSLDEVARRVGYEDAGTLRRLMRRELGRTPKQLRPHGADLR
jgi:transcriptional regulator GlxA family with amidase domain